jgi:hypothetical protein
MVKGIIEYWLENIMGCKYYWIRFEFQWRLVIHCHGIAWLPEPEGGLVKIAETAKEGHKAKE